MKTQSILVRGREARLLTCHTAVVGSGAAGYAAANRLYEAGQRDIVILTEGVNKGTSRNTGSDKQTYYKLSLCGGTADSVEEMARTYFAGRGMDGDLALCEAAFSPRCFYYLCEAGVPFPHNAFGEYSGYKTDHDPAMRATSAGPLTSKYMTECLERRARDHGITVYDNWLVISILVKESQCVGLMALNRQSGEYLLVNAANVVYASGGPAGVYKNSVYPSSQSGATGIALEAGAAAKNLAEWQYGIASLKFRWNLSGTYQQVLPRYVSTDSEGEDEREFLEGQFDSPKSLLTAVFLKGYQWPFDPAKVKNQGSSMIDMLVYRETVEKKRRVFLDYRRNPESLNRLGTDWLTRLGDPAASYLAQSGATQDTPIGRLLHMNPRAVELYRSHNIDLETGMLEIGVCAQHNNGGLAGDMWWESNLSHFFPVGEVNGSHGIHRPGGSALNAGQVGALRAAIRIAKVYRQDPMEIRDFLQTVREQAEEKMRLAEQFGAPKEDGLSPVQVKEKIGCLMSAGAAHIRAADQILQTAESLREIRRELLEGVFVKNPQELAQAFQTYDTLISAEALTAAINHYIKEGGESRGSYLIKENAADENFLDGPDLFGDSVQELRMRDGAFQVRWRPVRPIPPRDLWFENVWKEYESYGNS